MSNVQAFCTAIQSSILGLQSQRTEATLRAGANAYPFIGLASLAHMHGCISLVNQAFHAVKWAPVSIPTRMALYATPLMLTLEAMQHFLPDEIHPMSSLIYNHLSDVYAVASVVSSVIVFFFGHKAVGSASLAIFSIGFLEQRGIIPSARRDAWTSYALNFSLGLQFVTGNGVLLPFATLIYHFLSLYDLEDLIGFDTRYRTGTVVRPQINELTPGMLSGGNRYQLSINRKYIYYRPIPNVPRFDLQRMLDQFKEINWEDHGLVLQRKLLSDPRFKEAYSAPERVSQDEMIKFVTENFEDFIESVRKRKILVGAPANYEVLEAYLKIIGHRLETQDSMTRTDALLRLAIEGGRYCGPGRFEVAESVYSSIMDEADDAKPLIDVIANYLRYIRHQWLVNQFAETRHENLERVIDKQDVHVVHVLMNTLGPMIGIYSQSAENDESAQVSRVDTLWIDNSFKDKLLLKFWGQFGKVEDLIDEIQRGFFTNQLPKARVYDFLREWIGRQLITEEKKEELIDDLTWSSPKFMGIEIENNGLINRSIIAIMLWEMGILETWNGHQEVEKGTFVFYGAGSRLGCF
jgi:hypothetical protein